MTPVRSGDLGRQSRPTHRRLSRAQYGPRWCGAPLAPRPAGCGWYAAAPPVAISGSSSCAICPSVGRGGVSQPSRGAHRARSDPSFAVPQDGSISRFKAVILRGLPARAKRVRSLGAARRVTSPPPVELAGCRDAAAAVYAWPLSSLPKSEWLWRLPPWESMSA
jgi:hypothetical protein